MIPPGLDEFWSTVEPAARRLLALARDEDLGLDGDLSTLAGGLADRPARARVVARSGGTLAGLRALPAVLDAFAAALTRAEALARDGDVAAPGDAILELSGPLGELLAIERTLLNLLSRLSGVATLTSAYVRAAAMGAGGEGGSSAGSEGGNRGRAQVFDTRKTTPGLRALEKYAVRCGGGHSHRMGLDDAVLLKDNHLAHIPLDRLRAWLVETAGRARSRRPGVFIEVEADREDQFEEALASGVVDAVLLDNMAPPRLRACVRRRDAVAPGVLLEASGGVTLERIGEIARTGVDRISVGAITHQAAAIDLALDILR